MKTTVRVILSNLRVSRAPEDNHEITFTGIQKVDREVVSLPLLREDIFPAHAACCALLTSGLLRPY